MDGQPSVSGSDEEMVRWIRMVVRRAKWAGIAHAISPDSLTRRKPRFAILAALGFLRRSIGMGNPSSPYILERLL
jgi:hypothetical protein